MTPLSAADAVSPAIQRTKTFLFAPFKWGTFLKLSLVAVLTEGLSGNSNYSGGGGHGSRNGPEVYSPFHLSPEWIAAIVAALLLAMLLGFLVFYLITRLRFAFFHCLIHNTKEIGPGWQLYRAQAGRFFRLSVVVGLCFVVVLVLVALPFAAGFWRLWSESRAGGQLDIGLFLSLFLPLIPIILLLVLTAFAADLILRDLMMPHFALDNATAGEAWAAVWTRIKREKGPFVLYAVLRVVLPVAATIAVVIVFIIPVLIFGLAVAGIEAGIHSAIEGAPGILAVGGMVLEGLVGAVAFAIALLAVLCVGGPLSTAIRQYALVFYGGRYPALGDILYPPAAA